MPKENFFAIFRQNMISSAESAYSSPLLPPPPLPFVRLLSKQPSTGGENAMTLILTQCDPPWENPGYVPV